MEVHTKELIALLCELFDDSGLRRWVRQALGKEMHQALPGTTAAFDELCFQVVMQAEQRGLVDESFFDRLIEERSGQTERIHAVAAQWRDARRVRSSSAPRDGDVLPPLPIEDIPEPAPLPPGSRMHMRRNPQFVGRTEQLRALARALHADGKAAIGQVATVTGLGGIGKTQLAAELVHRYGQFFTGGVFWLSFADPASVPTEFAQCGGPGHLGLWTNETAPDLATQVARVRSVFAGPEPRLLVFDNCEDESLLDEWLPASGGCRVLQPRARAPARAHGHAADAVAHAHALRRGQAPGRAAPARPHPGRARAGAGAHRRCPPLPAALPRTPGRAHRTRPPPHRPARPHPAAPAPAALSRGPRARAAPRITRASPHDHAAALMDRALDTRRRPGDTARA